MESIFLILSCVILAAGVLYWFWSHIQLTQKKVQLLENAVFELRGMLSAGPPAPAGPSAPSGPEPVYNDLEEEEEWASAPAGQKEGGGSTPLDSLQETEELQPGGDAGQGIEQVEEAPISNEQFRELFIQRSGTAASPKEVPAPTSEALEAMPVKELRRLAEQRGITGVSELKKKELLSALRQQIQPAAATVPDTAVESVAVEKTLDLADEETPVLE
jgi:hypothetical protein